MHPPRRVERSPCDPRHSSLLRVRSCSFPLYPLSFLLFLLPSSFLPSFLLRFLTASFPSTVASSSSSFDPSKIAKALVLLDKKLDNVVGPQLAAATFAISTHTSAIQILDGKLEDLKKEIRARDRETADANASHSRKLQRIEDHTTALTKESTRYDSFLAGFDAKAHEEQRKKKEATEKAALTKRANAIKPTGTFPAPPPPPTTAIFTPPARPATVTFTETPEGVKVREGWERVYRQPIYIPYEGHDPRTLKYCVTKRAPPDTVWPPLPPITWTVKDEKAKHLRPLETKEDDCKPSTSKAQDQNEEDKEEISLSALLGIDSDDQ